MVEKFSETEMKIATDLINKGLERAAVSLKMILNSAIEITNIDFDIEVLDNEPQYSSKKDNEVHVLRTELAGDLKGICHLIYASEEIHKIYSKCLPESVLSANSPDSEMMKLELLKEIDNIMAASVITEFANSLDVGIYGKVPSLHIMEAVEVNKYIQEESESLSPLIHFSSVFHTDDIDIKSDFVWLLEEDFIQKIKNLALK